MTNQQSVDFNNIRVALNSSAIVATTNRIGEIIYANEKFCELSKYQESELIGQNHRILNSGVHPKEFFNKMWSTIVSGKKWEGEICNRAKDGSLYWVHTVIVPFKNEKDEIVEFVSIRWDITEKMNLGTELIKNNEDKQSLIDASFQGLVIYDLSGRVCWLNSVAEVLLSHSEKVLLNGSIESLLGSDYAIFQVGHQTLNIEIGAQTRVIETSTKNYNFKNHTAYLLGFQDVTEKSMIESQILQQERLAAVGILASGLAHEIGTPLGVMRGRAEMMGMIVDLPETALQSSQIIIHQIDRISHLIQSLLKLARGTTTENAEAVAIYNLLTEVKEFITHELNRNNIELKIVLPKDLKVKAVYTSLFQVFLNLFINSIHAIESRGKAGKDFQGLLQVRHERKLDHDIIEVFDNGCGISDENISRLFTPFFTTKDIGKGTGLGLVTSYRIVQGWGGFITVQSQINKGTTFGIHLPIIENN